MLKDSFLGATVHVCHKGGNSQAEMARANTISDQQLGLMRQQLSMQQQQLNMVNPSLQAIIQNGGMLPAQQAAMTTQAMQGLGGQYKNLQGQLSQQLQARGITGGDMAGGGDIARSFGSLGAMEAGQQSDLLNQIQLQKGQGLMNALGVGLGEGQMFGQQAMGFGGQGVSALGSGVSAANNADQAQTGFFGSLIGGLAGLGGSAMTSFCVASETMIAGTDKSDRAENLRVGDQVLGVDGSVARVVNIESSAQLCIRLLGEDGNILLCTHSHTLLRPNGGYVRAMDALGESVKSKAGSTKITSTEAAGVCRVYSIALNGTHTYLSNDFWSEE